jgi:spoIIIJ-associated protein
MSAAQVGDAAANFLNGLVAAFGLTGTSSVTTDEENIEVRVDGDNLGLLVGPRGTTLQAVQDLTRVAAQRRLGDHDTRLRIDIGGYRERRQAALSSFAIKQADEVIASGVARVLEPMSSADRKVIHDTLTAVDGVVTRSEGDDPYRRVIIAPATND